MRLRQLTYFTRVAEAGSFSAAASRIRIAQPALSQQISRLEAELKTALFVRHAHGVTLTEAGMLFLEQATLALHHVERAKNSVLAAGTRPQGEVGLGLAPSIAISVAIPIIETLATEAPLVRLRIVEAHSDYLAGLLRQDRLDLAAIFDLPDAHGLELETLFTEELYLVGPPDHKSPRSQGKAFSSLAMVPLILPTRAQGLRIAVEREALRLKIPLTIRAELDSIATILSAIRLGLGHSVLSRASIIHDLVRPRLPALRIENPTIRRSAQLAAGAGRERSSAVRLVSDVVRQLISDRAARGEWHVSGAELQRVID